MNHLIAKRQRDPDATREALLDAALEEIQLHGFQSASLNSILQRAGVTKGALYHHFGNKHELGLAVVDELVRSCIIETFVTPLRECDDPIACMQQIVEGEVGSLSDDQLVLGCPLTNVSQEMAPIDEGFREATDRIIHLLRDSLADALRRGQSAGKVRDDIDPEAVATFVVAARQGTIGLTKATQDAAVCHQVMNVFGTFLQALRPEARQLPRNK